MHLFWHSFSFLLLEHDDYRKPFHFLNTNLSPWFKLWLISRHSLTHFPFVGRFSYTLHSTHPFDSFFLLSTVMPYFLQHHSKFVHYFNSIQSFWFCFLFRLAMKCWLDRICWTRKRIEMKIEFKRWIYSFLTIDYNVCESLSNDLLYQRQVSHFSIHFFIWSDSFCFLFSPPTQLLSGVQLLLYPAVWDEIQFDPHFLH